MDMDNNKFSDIEYEVQVNNMECESTKQQF